MGLFLVTSTHAPAIMTVCIVWGIAMMLINLSMQVRVLSLAPDATDVSMSLMSGIYNIGIGAGALIGNQVISHLGMNLVGYVGSAFALISLVWCLYSLKKYPQLRSNL